jgi:hypothetical protein
MRRSQCNNKTPQLVNYKLLFSLFIITFSLNISTIRCDDIRSIKQTIGGTYRDNVTLFQRNGPYRVSTDLNVESGVTLTIETGTKLYFDSGVGMRIRGTLYAVVCCLVRAPIINVQLFSRQDHGRVFKCCRIKQLLTMSMSFQNCDLSMD